jgi:hypothetical protein
VRGVSPFSHAFNTAVAQVRTPFFIQVDADMILDDTCVADLTRVFTERVGVVVGHLRDPLQGRIRGIKVFRTACCRRVPLCDTPSPETDFNEHILPHGWTNVYALKVTEGPPADWPIFGEHRPDYTLPYVFSKYVREGIKARYRRVVRSGILHLEHRGSLLTAVAAIAYAHGLFVGADRDIQTPGAHAESYRLVERFLEHLQENAEAPAMTAGLVQPDPESTFRRSYALGVRLQQPPDPAVFLATLNSLQQAPDVGSWVALLGLCQGLFVDRYREEESAAAFDVLRGLLPARASTPRRDA